MTDKEFWLLFRRALLIIVSAIEKKYDIKSKCDIMPTSE